MFRAEHYLPTVTPKNTLPWRDGPLSQPPYSIGFALRPGPSRQQSRVVPPLAPEAIYFKSLLTFLDRFLFAPGF